MASAISSFDGGLQLIGRSFLAGKISDGSLGNGLFHGVSKSSFHLSASYASLPKTVFPSYS